MTPLEQAIVNGITAGIRGRRVGPPPHLLGAFARQLWFIFNRDYAGGGQP